MTDATSSWSSWLAAASTVIGIVTALISVYYARLAHKSQKKASAAADLAERARASISVSEHLHKYQDFKRINQSIFAEAERDFRDGASAQKQMQELERGFSILMDLVRSDWQKSSELGYVDFAINETERLSRAWPKRNGKAIVEVSGEWILPLEVTRRIEVELQKRGTGSLQVPGFFARIRSFEELKR